MYKVLQGLWTFGYLYYQAGQINFSGFIKMQTTNPRSYEFKKGILSQVDKNIHVSTLKEDGVDKPCFEHGYGDLTQLIEIERFVDEVLQNEQLPYEAILNDQNDVVEHREHPLSRFQKKIRQFLSYSQLNKMYELSENVKLFFDTAKRYPSLYGCLADPAILRRRGKVVGISDSYLLFNEFVKTIRERGNSQEFKERVKQRARKSDDNTHSAIRYVNQLFEVYSRLLMVRVDVSYYKNYFQIVTPEMTRKHRQSLLNNLGVKSVFKDCVGYIWKLEYGQSKGFHYHFIFFFDGSKRHKDKHIADQIGLYWINDITEGLGIYHNANKNRYPKKATGMIKHDDMVKRSYLTEIVIPYLTKQEQYLMAKQDGMRTFGKGVIKKEKGNMGRPRKEYLVSV